MTTDTLDPLIHVPARLRIIATLAALPEGDALSFTRLQEMIGLTPGNLITHLRKLEDAEYLTTEKTGNGPASRTRRQRGHPQFASRRRSPRQSGDRPGTARPYFVADGPGDSD
ncbi:MAG: transcriptional regulator [Solirubrobacteraceae bacterium]